MDIKFNCLNDIANFLKNAELKKKVGLGKMIQTIRDNLRDQNIQVFVELVSEYQDNRIMFKTALNKCKFKTELCYEANGAIMTCEGNILLRPVRNTHSRFITKDEIDDFTITRVLDGTQVNLYYYHNSWIWSTRGAYDISSYKWFTEKTYGEAIKECLPPNFEKSLSKDSYYSFILSHKEFHPCVTQNKLTFIGSNCNKKPNVEEIIPVTITLKQLIKDCNYSDTYGYILRKSDEDVMILSKKYKKIKRQIYDLKYNTSDFTPKQRYYFMLLKNIMNPTEYNKFNYEVFEDDVKYLNLLFVDIAANIIHKPKELKRKTDNSVYSDDQLNTLIDVFTTHNYGISFSKNYSFSVIMDCIKNIQNINIFIKVLKQ